MTSGLSTFALFSVDDLARMVGKAMQQRVGDNKVATQIATELRSAGVTMADTGSGCVPSVASCTNCLNGSEDARNAAQTAFDNCMLFGGDFASCDQSTHYCQRLNDAAAVHLHCVCHCDGLGLPLIDFPRCVAPISNDM